LDGADKTKLEIEMNLDLSHDKDYRPPVVKVSASRNENIEELVEKLIEHREYLEKTNKLMERRKKNAKLEIIKLAEEELLNLIINKSLEENLLDNLAESILLKKMDPYTAKDRIINLINY